MGLFSKIEPNDVKILFVADKILKRASYKMVSSSFKFLPYVSVSANFGSSFISVPVCCKSSVGCSTKYNCNPLHHSIERDDCYWSWTNDLIYSDQRI